MSVYSSDLFKASGFTTIRKPATDVLLRPAGMNDADWEALRKQWTREKLKSWPVVKLPASLDMTNAENIERRRESSKRVHREMAEERRRIQRMEDFEHDEDGNMLLDDDFNPIPKRKKVKITKRLKEDVLVDIFRSIEDGNLTFAKIKASLPQHAENILYAAVRTGLKQWTPRPKVKGRGKQRHVVAEKTRLEKVKGQYFVITE